MLEILRILDGRVSVGLKGITVQRTMVERHVQPLKLRARLLCDFTRVRDTSWESMETLEADEVTKQVAKLVTPATVVVVENTVEAFSTTYLLDLVLPLLLSCFLLLWAP